MEAKSIRESAVLAHHGVNAVKKNSDSNFLEATGNGSQHASKNQEIKLVNKKEIARL